MRKVLLALLLVSALYLACCVFTAPFVMWWVGGQITTASALQVLYGTLAIGAGLLIFLGVAYLAVVLIVVAADRLGR